MKRFLFSCVIFTLILSLSLSAAAFGTYIDGKRILSPPIWYPENALTDNENLPVATNDAMYSEWDMGYVEAYSTGFQKFVSKIDGYSIIIPTSMTVDMSLSDVGAYFEDSHRTLRIFKETFKTIPERESYLEYSNRFIQNKTNHTVESDTTFSQGGYTYHVLQWTRSKLTKVKNDKNYYACVDVCIGARVYTFFFTSDQPFYLCGGYMDIVNSLQTFDPIVASENAYNRGYKASSVSHFNSYAKATYDNLFSDDADFKMGMFAPEVYGGFEKMEEFERTLNYKFCAFLVYTEFPDKHATNTITYASRVANYISKIEQNFIYARNTGRAIELTLQTPLSRLSDSNMIYEILNGEYEQFIKAYAKMVAKYQDVTVLFRPFNEMNCDWCNYSAYFTSRDPSLYVELYRYLYNQFKAAGCTNTIWVWNPNEKSFPGYKWNSESLYYPGDEYVDVYGLTGYNTGTYYPSEIWRSFDEIYEPIYKRALKINEKPIMITEFSCSSVGGDKIAWIDDMFNSLHKYDKIKVGIWWHAADYDGDTLARPYFMDTPDGTLSVFKKYLQ